MIGSIRSYSPLFSPRCGCPFSATTPFSSSVCGCGSPFPQYPVVRNLISFLEIISIGSHNLLRGKLQVARVTFLLATFPEYEELMKGSLRQLKLALTQWRSLGGRLNLDMEWEDIDLDFLTILTCRHLSGAFGSVFPFPNQVECPGHCR